MASARRDATRQADRKALLDLLERLVVRLRRAGGGSEETVVLLSHGVRGARHTASLWAVLKELQWGANGAAAAVWVVEGHDALAAACAADANGSAAEDNDSHGAAGGIDGSDVIVFGLAAAPPAAGSPLRGSYARWVVANKAAAPAAPPAIVTSEAPAAADGVDDAWADAGNAADATFDEHDDVEGFAFELLSTPEAASESGAPSRALFARKGDHVTLHFVGSFVEGGATFCSSRTGRCKPFALVLGEASTPIGLPTAVEGWDRALPRVPLGGVARVTLPPQVGARS